MKREVHDVLGDHPDPQQSPYKRASLRPEADSICIDCVPRHPAPACDLPPSHQIVSIDALVVHPLLSAPPLSQHPPDSTLEGSTCMALWASCTASDDSALWESRMAMLTVRDLLTLHKQWLQRSSMWLVRAEQDGPRSHAYSMLSGFNDAYVSFVERAMEVTPYELWEQRAHLDAETMSMMRPPHQSDLNGALRETPRANLKNLLQTFWKCESSLALLQAERDSLLRRRDDLREVVEGRSSRSLVDGTIRPEDEVTAETGAGGAVEVGGSVKGARAAEGEGPMTAEIELSEVLCLLDANIKQQWSAKRKFIVGVSTGTAVTTRVKTYLQFYPWVFSAMDGYDAIRELASALVPS